MVPDIYISVRDVFINKIEESIMQYLHSLGRSSYRIEVRYPVTTDAFTIDPYHAFRHGG